MFDLLGGIIAVIVIIYFIRRSRKGIENPHNMSFNKDEIKVAEVFVKTRDATHSGFTGADSPLKGRLILTSKRLLYTTYDQKKITLNFEPNEIESIEYIDTSNIVIGCQGKSFKFNVQEQAVINGNPIVFMEDKNYQSMTTNEKFRELIILWKQGKLTADRIVISENEPTVNKNAMYCYHCGEEISSSKKNEGVSIEKCPKCGYHQ